MRQSYLIIYNALTNYGRAIIQGLISFLLVPFIVNRINSEQYGIVILATTSYGMITLFGTGLNKAVIKYHAQARAKNRTHTVNLVFNNSLALFLIIGLLGSIVVFILGIFFEHLFHVPAYLVDEGQKSLFIIAITIMPCLLLDVYKGILSGEQRYDVVNFISLSAVVFRALAIVGYFFIFSPSLISVVVIYSLSYIVERLGYLVASHKIFKDIKVSFKYISRLGIKIIVGFSLMVLIATMANMLAAHFFKFVIGAKLTLSNLTYYGVLLLLTTTAALLVRSFVNVLVPVASKYYELKDFHRINKILLHGTKYSIVIILSLAFITIPFLKSLLLVWMGAEFVHIWTIGVIMFIAQIVSSTAITANQVLSGLGKVKILAVSSTVSVAVGLGLSLLYLFFSTAPILLVAVALISIQRLINSVIINSYSLKISRIKFWTFFRKAYFMPFSIGFLMLITGIVLTHFVAITSWRMLFLTVGMVEAVYFGLIYLFALTSEEKYLIHSFTHKSIQKFAK